jgi:hypothetical protein
MLNMNMACRPTNGGYCEHNVQMEHCEIVRWERNGSIC